MGTIYLFDIELYDTTYLRRPIKPSVVKVGLSRVTIIRHKPKSDKNVEPHGVAMRN